MTEQTTPERRDLEMDGSSVASPMLDVVTDAMRDLAAVSHMTTAIRLLRERTTATERDGMVPRILDILIADIAAGYPDIGWLHPGDSGDSHEDPR